MKLGLQHTDFQANNFALTEGSITSVKEVKEGGQHMFPVEMNVSQFPSLVCLSSIPFPLIGSLPSVSPSHQPALFPLSLFCPPSSLMPSFSPQLSPFFSSFFLLPLE